MELDKLLLEKFGHVGFRGAQRPVLECLLRGEDAFCVMPTGSGKSLCYQMPVFWRRGGVLVVSPLIALMQDQVDQAIALGIRARFINSTLSSAERRSREAEVASGHTELLFVTPERFRKNDFWEALNRSRPFLFVVDEVHCVSGWGHDFRPEFSRLGEVRERLGRPTTLLLTATATKATREDVRRQMGMPTIREFIEPVERSNLALLSHDVYGDAQKIQRLLFHLQTGPRPAIVYFALISTLERLAAQCRDLGLQLTTYHGSLPAGVRRENQRRFMNDEVEIIFATSAFGLGVNKPNVRQVLHAELPGSVEAYYQEVGRAGRDGQPAECHLLLDEDDLTAQMDFIKWSNPDAGFIKAVYRKLVDDGDRVRQGGEEYLRQQMNFYNSRDFRLETVLQLLVRWDCLLLSDRGLREYQVLDRLPDDLIKERELLERVKVQSQKLLDLVRLVRRFETPLNEDVYAYFS